MKATARRLNGRHRHEVEIGSFRFAAGEPTSEGGAAGTPTPQELLAASLAACSALTMEAYAARKGWDIGDVVVEVDYECARRGSPSRCEITVRAPEHLPDEQLRRLMSVAAKSPVHRTLEGETMFDERLELAVPEATAADQQPTRRFAASNRLLRRFLPPDRRGAPDGSARRDPEQDSNLTT
jgi:putative redox protein